MESPKDSTQVPLLEPESAQKQVPNYFDTNLIDKYMFFWVNKFVDVLFPPYTEFFLTS